MDAFGNFFASLFVALAAFLGIATEEYTEVGPLIATLVGALMAFLFGE